MMPVAGALFALDGVFFGAGDLAFLRRVTLFAALGASCRCSSLAHASISAWAACGPGISAFIAVRMLLGGLRWRSRRWLVAGTQMVDEL